MDTIARELLIRWEELSPSLGLKQHQEQNIRRTYSEYADQKREALRAWKHNKGKGATFGALIAAAEKVSNMQLADGIRDLMETLQGRDALYKYSVKGGKILQTKIAGATANYLSTCSCI